MSDETNTDVDNNTDSNNRDKNDGSRCRRRFVAHTVILVLLQHRIVTPRGIGRTGLLDVGSAVLFLCCAASTLLVWIYLVLIDALILLLCCYCYCYSCCFVCCDVKMVSVECARLAACLCVSFFV